MDYRPSVTAPQGMITRNDTLPLRGLSARPIGVHFATQDADEVIYVIARKDVITNFGWVAQIALLSMIPIVAFFLLRAFNINIRGFLPTNYEILAVMLYYSLLFTSVVINIVNWFFNVFIVTNKRILVYKFAVFESKRVAEANLANIEDVSQSVVGFFPTLFGYGDLLVQTAGQRSKFKIESIPRPTWMRNILVDLARLSRNPEP